MLNEKITDVIQLISLPLELLGFILTLIEIYNSKLADKIESKLDIFSELTKITSNIDLFIANHKNASEEIKSLIASLNQKIQKGTNNFTDPVEIKKQYEYIQEKLKIKDANLDKVMSLIEKISLLQYVILPVVFYIYWHLIYRLSINIFGNSFFENYKIVFYIAFISSIIYLLFKIAPYTEKLIYRSTYIAHIGIKFLNNLTNGKALGAIGVILAGIGLIGEVVQVLAILLR